MVGAGLACAFTVKPLVEARQWAEYFAAGADDPVNPAVLAELQAQQRAGRAIVLMTGCPEQHRTMTLDKLRRAGIEFAMLLMRPESNFAKNHDLKSAWLSQLAADYEFMAAFDDMPQSVSLFAGAGIPAFLVKDCVPVFEHGTRPKVGLGVGRKARVEKTKPIPVRFPLSDIEKYTINSDWLHRAARLYMAQLDAQSPMCQWNNLARENRLGLCVAEPEAYPILSGDCPCDDFLALLDDD